MNNELEQLLYDQAFNEYAEMVDEQAALRWFVASDAWKLILKPMLESRRDWLIAQLINPTEQRKTKLPSDVIRGSIITLTYLMNLPEKVLHRVAQAAQARMEQPEDDPLR